MTFIIGEENKKRGYTLIEVLIALAVFAIGFLALAGLQAKYTRSNARARIMTEAIALADSTLARLKALPFAHRDLDPGIARHQPAGNSGTYRVQWRVRADVPVRGTKTVSVLVIPQNRLFSRPVRLSAVLAD